MIGNLLIMYKMEIIFNYIGICAFSLLMLFIGMVIGGMIREAGLKQWGWKVIHNPDGQRKYIVQDEWAQRQEQPNYDPYAQMFNPKQDRR